MDLAKTFLTIGSDESKLPGRGNKFPGEKKLKQARDKKKGKGQAVLRSRRRSHQK